MSTIVDVYQNVGSPADTAVSDFPSQLKHGLYDNFGRRRAATGLEGMIANGWHIHEMEDDPFMSALSPFLQTLSESSLKELSSNGMSLPPLCAWMLHAALHTRRRDSAHLSEERCADTFQEQEDEDELDDVEESTADWASE